MGTTKLHLLHHKPPVRASSFFVSLRHKSLCVVFSFCTISTLVYTSLCRHKSSLVFCSLVDKLAWCGKKVCTVEWPLICNQLKTRFFSPHPPAASQVKTRGVEACSQPKGATHPGERDRVGIADGAARGGLAAGQRPRPSHVVPFLFLARPANGSLSSASVAFWGHLAALRYESAVRPQLERGKRGGAGWWVGGWVGGHTRVPSLAVAWPSASLPPPSKKRAHRFMHPGSST